MNKILLVLILSFGIILSACAPATTDVKSEEKIMEDEKVEDEMMDDEEHMINESMEKEEVIDDIREIEIDSFGFGYSMEEVKVKVGETVRITLTNSGGNHDFVVDELGIATAVISSGNTDTIEFTATADQVGEYFFYCSVGSHRAAGMEGKFIVEE